MERSRKYEIGVGLLLLVALSLMAWMSVKVGALKGMGEVLQATVALPDAAGLGPGSEVKIAGVTVGTVRELVVEHDLAQVHFDVKQSVGLRQDAIAQVRARSLLGEKFLELLPQSPDAPLLADGGRIAQVRGQTEIDQLVNAMGPLLTAADPAELRAIVSTLHAVIAKDPERVERMVVDLETLLHNGAVASAELSPLLVESRAAVRELRQVGRQVQPTLERTERLVLRLDEATEGLPEMSADVQGLVGETRGAVADARAVLADIHSSSDQIHHILDNVEQIDKWELRRLLREEGIVVRLRESAVVPTEE